MKRERYPEKKGGYKGGGERMEREKRYLGVVVDVDSELYICIQERKERL